MDLPIVDPKRSGVPVSVIDWTEPPMFLHDSRWYGPLGAFIDQVSGIDLDHWSLCCPGCGQLGSPREGQHWHVASGSFEDLAHLSLMPSILKNCCGWHGYLTLGKFIAC